MRKCFISIGEVGSVTACEEPITAPGLLETGSAKPVGWWLKACFLEPEGLGSNPAFVALQRFDFGEVTRPFFASFAGWHGCLPEGWWESLRVCGCLVINPLMAQGKDWNLLGEK